MPSFPTLARAFTLVELLVVVTIIALLIAMLVPAVEAARHQAKLAVCSANLKTVASAATLYASDHQSHYPDRDPDYYWDALHIRTVYPGLEYDLRPKFGPYMSIQAFTDPLLGEPRLDDAGVAADSNLLSSFNIYTDLMRGADPRAGGPDTDDVMERVGQRFESTDYKSAGAPIKHRFSVIAGDRDMYFQGPNFWSASSHPDQNTPPLLRPRYYRSTGPSKLTYSEWVGPRTSRLVDLNYAYTDGSVRRFNAVTRDDERMAKIVSTDLGEYQTASATAGRFEHLPKE